MLGVVLLLIVLAIALAAGLALSAKKVYKSATAARADLQAFKVALQSGDQVAAAARLADAHAQLAVATKAANSTSVKIGDHIPGVWIGPRDLHHLLRAATLVTDAGDRTLGVYREVSGANSKLFKGGRFNLAVLAQTTSIAHDLLATVGQARHELLQVWPHSLARKPLLQVDDLEKQARPLQPFLGALPEIVGAHGPRTYLVTVLNPAELRPSGGAPLSIAVMKADRGVISTPLSGATFHLTDGNALIGWPTLPNDPWLPRGRHRFVSANFSPNWPTSGEELLRAFKATTGSTADGVIAVDPAAMADVLATTGPIQTQGYGRLDSKNLAKTLLIDAYERIHIVELRRAYNAEVTAAFLKRVESGGGLLGKMKALGAAALEGHVKVYFRNAGLRSLVTRYAVGGVLPPTKPDELAVYTSNTNASKVDVYQHRSIRQVVRVNSDGSAAVDRTVTIVNDTPPYQGTGFDPRTGYDTRWSIPMVAEYLPASARSIRLSAPNVMVKQARYTHEKGRLLFSGVVTIPPGSRVTLRFDYRLPAGTLRHGKGLRYAAQLDAQPMFLAPSLDLEVVAPRGWHSKVVPGWRREGAALRWSESFVRSGQVLVELIHG